jgi:group I intron endonuclease
MKGIYKITSPSGKVYIGQAYDIHIRWSKDYEKYNCKKQRKLYNSFIKYGVENHKFEVMQIVNEDIEQKYLNLSEQLFAVKELEKGNELLNIRQPGSNGRHSKETIQKLREFALGRNHTEKTKEKISNSTKGIKKSEGHSENIGKAHSKPIIQFDNDNKLIKEWKSARAASNDLNIQYKNISASARGKREKAGGYVWKFKTIVNATV